MESLSISVNGQHLRQLVDALANSGSLTRDDLIRQTGWARSTLSRVVGTLLDARLLVEADLPRTGGRGRPTTSLSLNPTFGVAIGLDFGFRHVRGILADASHRVLARHELELEVDYSPESGFAAAAHLIDALISAADVPSSRMVGVAAAVPAPVDRDSGLVAVSSMLPSWGGVNVKAGLTEAVGFPTIIDNDSKMAAAGEQRWGAGQGIDDFVYIKMHSGIGGAAVAGGRLIHGATGAAGHFGHISMDLAGPLCRCGSRGCLEVYSGVPAILDALAPVHGRLTLSEALRMLDAGDPACVRVINEAALRVGQVAGFLCSAFDPTAIILGGALSAAFARLLPSVSAGLASTAMSAGGLTEIRLGALGKDASAMGALGVALNHGLVARLNV